MSVYEFGSFSLNVSERSLVRRGRLLKLPHKPFDVLTLLVENNDRVVTKEELIQTIWRDKIVEESNLTVALTTIRKLLGDDRRQPKYIVTLHRHGYRFIAEVRQVQRAGINSVAVLPFTFDRKRPDSRYLADALTESLIHSLSSLHNIKVVSLSAVLSCTEKEIDAVNIASTLRVNSIVNGRITLHGEDVTISVDLLDHGGEELVWGKQYHCQITDVLPTQHAIFRKLAEELNRDRWSHVRNEGALCITKVNEQSESCEAQRSYRTGRYLWSHQTKDALQQAIQCFRRSTEIDPHYAPAYMATVDCYLRLCSNYFLPPDLSPALHGVVADDLSREKQASLRLRDEWDAATGDRETRRAGEFTSTMPDAKRWHAAAIFCRAVYEEALHKREQGEGATQVRQNPPRFLPITLSEDVQIACIIARDQVEVGNIDAAYLMLHRWYTLGEWPRVEGLNPQLTADLLLTTGLLAGRYASSRLLPWGQKHAEALLNGAIGFFEQLRLKPRAGEARSELGRCYDREGMFDLARATFLSALQDMPLEYAELRSRTLVRLAFAEMKVGHLREALKRLEEASEIVGWAGSSVADFYHIEMSTTLGELSIAERSQKHLEQACKHYELALSSSKAVGHHRRTAVLENNHGYLMLAFGRLEEAESALMRARALFRHFAEPCPQLDETLARFHLEINRIDLAEETIVQSVSNLERAGEDALLAESLRTQGRILCKLGRHREAKSVLDRAYQIARNCGDTEGAGLALLITIEELSEHLGHEERLELLTPLRPLLVQSQRTAVLERLEKLPSTKYSLQTERVSVVNEFELRKLHGSRK